MGRAESRGAGADSFYLVLLVVARLKLWLILMACLRHLVSALTNTDDILKVAFADLLSGSQGSPTVPSPQLFQNHSRRVRIRLSFADLVSRSQPCRVLRSQGYPPSPQSFQNRSRRDHRQVRSSRVTRQDLQPSSQYLANTDGLLVSALRHQTRWHSEGALSSSSQ